MAALSLEVGVMKFQLMLLMLKSPHKTTVELVEIDWIDASKVDRQLSGAFGGL